MSASRNMPLLDRVRGAVGQLKDPFTTADVCDVLGFDHRSQERSCVQAWLRYLEKHQGELVVEIITRRGVGGKIAEYRRTKSFRSEAFNPIAQKVGGAFLQGLYLEWGGARAKQHAAD